MDLADWVRRRRFRGLLELILQLPEASRFHEARINDPEIARPIAVAEREAELRGKPRGSWTPRYAEWTLTAQLLKDIREAVIRSGDLALIAGGGKPKHVGNIPTPETEVDRIKNELMRGGQMEIIAIFAPHALRKV